MPGSPQLVPRPNPRTPKRQSRIKQQVDVLALEVQTLSLVLSDLRRRLSELEKKFNTDKITDADRGLLKNLDTMFGKPSLLQLLLLSGAECSPPSPPLVRAARPNP
jgi:hypothetical protein